MSKSETKRQISEINTQLDGLLEDDRRIKQANYDPWVRDLLLEMNERGIRDWPFNQFGSYTCKNKKDLNREKMRLQFNLNPSKEGFIGTTDIEMARGVPVTEFIIFKNKVAKCLWHDDSHPSMHYFYRTNSVKCFSCGANEDVIGVVQKLYGLSFIEAVKKLTHV